MRNSWWILLIGSLVLASCKSKKDQIGNLKAYPTPKIVQMFTDSSTTFDWFSAKISTNFDSRGERSMNMNANFRTSLRMRADSLIWFQISSGPVIVAQSILTKDSVKAVIKPEKKYFERDISYINQQFGLNLEHKMLEDIFIGNPLGLDVNDKYKLLEDTSYYLISTHTQRQIDKAFEKLPRREDRQYIARYWIYPNNFKPRKILINHLSDTSNLEIIYESYKEKEGKYFPDKVYLKGTSPRDTVELELNYSKFKVDKPQRFPYKISDKYEKLE